MSTKSAILSELRASPDFISGEMLAKNCSVSRTAIWKAIRSLEDDGFKIEAVKNRGYKIISEPDRLDPISIENYLSKNGLKSSKIYTFKEIDSTNSEAKRRSADVGAFRDAQGNLTERGKMFHKSLFASEMQTAGRGRLGRTFVSPADSGVYFSFMYSPKAGVQNPALYTAAAAVAVSRMVSALFDEKCSVKWVNDIFLGGKKIAGILTEGIANFETGNIEAAIVGIGINLKSLHLDGEISKIVGSIEEAKISWSKKYFPRAKNEVVADVVKNLIYFYESFETGDETIKNKMIEEYRSLSMLIGKKVTVNPVAGQNFESYSATVSGISDEIALVVKTDDGIQKELHSGEVSLHSYDFI